MTTTQMTPHMETVATFSVPYLQFINEESHNTQALPGFATHETLLALYRHMSLVRVMDQKAIHMHRTGLMGTYPATLGQEAVGTGLGSALRKNDVFVTYYRDQATLLYRGVTPAEILGYWQGDERCNDFSSVNPKDFPVCVPIACQCVHAAGVAVALKYRQQQSAVATVIGEGGTSKGDFYEALNLAGAWSLPLVFVVNNNHWAISVPLDKQTAAQTIAQKAIAAGIPGIQVDGNDVVAVRYAVEQALETARQGGGPTLIEALTYRLCDHTTVDDAKRYYDEEAIKNARQKEPLARLGHYLESHKLWSREQDAALQEELKTYIDSEIETLANKEPQAPEAMFDSMYADLPVSLQEQRAQQGERQ